MPTLEVSPSPSPAPFVAPTSPQPMRGLTPGEIVSEIKIGTNYANALEYYDFDYQEGYIDYGTNGQDKIDYIFRERSQGWIYPTKELIHALKEAGYDAVRLPISLTCFINEDFDIDEAKLDQIELVVNYILADNMYCIIDPHYDYLNKSWVGDKWEPLWMDDQYADYVWARYEAIWRQLAERFKNYGDKLLFEAANEPASDCVIFHETYGDDADFDAYVIRNVNKMNEIFVRTVRETGGNNSERTLVMALPQTEQSYFINQMSFPEDDNIIVTVHYYFHYEDWAPVTQWSSNNESDTAPIDAMFAYVRDFKQNNDIPVIMGEWGSTEFLTIDERIDQAQYILAQAKALGVPCFWWEFGWNDWEEGTDNCFGLYDRINMEWHWPQLVEACMEIAKGE